MIQVISGLQDGIAELGCHPGLGSDIDTMYLREREVEVAVLCDSRVQEPINAQGIKLCSFRDIGCQEKVSDVYRFRSYGQLKGECRSYCGDL